MIVRLDDMAHGGAAVGRHEGKVVFVPYGIPGELARVEMVKDKGRYAHARLVEILEPSPERVEPPCPYFGRCGGCHWQHVAYEAQLRYKQAIIRSQLERISGLPSVSVSAPMGMSEPWRYRNHMQFGARPDGRLGLIASGGHRIVPIEHCLLMHPLLADVFDSIDIDVPDLLRVSLRAGVHTGEQMVVLEMADDLVPDIEIDLPVSCVLLLADGTPLTLVGYPYVHERLSDLTLRVSATSFFQVNSVQAESLVTLVSAYLDPAPGSTLVDAYCGVGTLSLGLAPKVEQLIGVDTSATAIADAQKNAEGIRNAQFFCGRLPEVAAILTDEELSVVVDPPRSGLDKETFSALVDLKPSRIVYVSCDPATLARDIRRLTESCYRLCRVQPVDMFPQTYHIESVALLDRV